MDMRQLRYFAAIAEEGQITKAAKKLHMAQPPLSQQLKALEQELGTLLVERNGKNTELTEAGKILYDRAKELLHRIDETIIEVKEIGEGLQGTLSIGSVKTCFSYLPQRLKLFRKQHPNVTFRLFEGDSYRLAQDLKNRDIELAIVRLPLELNGFSSLPLPTDQFVGAFPKQWMNDNTIPLRELKNVPLMLLHRVSGVGLYELVVEKFRKHKIEPNIICQCPDASMLISLVRAGVGVALLPRSALLSFSTDDLKIVEINDEIIESESAVIWLKDRYLSKNAMKFIETFKED